MGNANAVVRKSLPGEPAPAGDADLDPVLTSGAILGSWCVVKLLGEGGMGRVYLAEHTSIGRRVAIKVLKRALARSPELVERFFAEAHAVNRIRHPGIVEVTDCFVDDGGTPCLVMEFLQGRTLAEQMALTRISPTRVAAIGAEVATALDAAHKAGVIHRDLKPDNLFLVDKDGVSLVKVLDFGVAKLMDPMPNSTVHTVAGSIMGTPDYMAPEQLAGKPVDARADIYALGASLYHACTGRPPFQASNFGDLVVMHLTKPPPRPSCFANLPPVLEQVLLAMLEKDPACRPQTMGDVALLLCSAQKLGGALAVLAPAIDGSQQRQADASAPAVPAARNTAPFVAAVGSIGFAGFVAPLELRVKIGAIAVPRAASPHSPTLTGTARAPLATASTGWFTPLQKRMPSGTLSMLPRAAPGWAWAAVAGLLLVAVGGGAWSAAQPEPAVVASSQLPAPLIDDPLADGAELTAQKTATLASTKRSRPTAFDSDSVRTWIDATATSRVAQRDVGPAVVAKKTGSKLKKTPPAKTGRTASTIAERRAVLDPFAKEPR